MASDVALAAVRERVAANAASVAASAVADASSRLAARREGALSVHEQEVLAVLAARLVAGTLPDADATNRAVAAGASPDEVAVDLDALFSEA